MLERLEKFSSKVLLLAVRGLIRELCATREVGQELVDTLRDIHGLPPKYRELPAEPTSSIEEDRLSVIPPGAHLTYWLIEELCLEHFVPFGADVNLEGLAIERGWLSPEGKMLVLPQSAIAAGMTVDGVNQER